MRVAVDVMGGDHAPAEILLGCWHAAPLLADGDVVCLVGDEAEIHRGLDSSSLTGEQGKHFKVIPTTQVILMDDSPVEAIRSKPDSSISVMCKLAAKGEVDAVISAGNTGACVATAKKGAPTPAISTANSQSIGLRPAGGAHPYGSATGSAPAAMNSTSNCSNACRRTPSQRIDQCP